MQTQIMRNNMRSILLLMMFPAIILAMVWLFFAIIAFIQTKSGSEYVENPMDWDFVWEQFIATIPWVIAGVAIWFVIAYFFNASMIKHATGARPLTRMENPRVYNIVENLTIACGMDMPQINVVDDPQLNAFASGIDKKSYTVTLTTGIINLLDDEELAGVVGHELTHIRNRDTKLLITSIIFVGIISTLISLVVRMIYSMALYGGVRDSKEKGGGAIVMLLVGLVCSAIAYFFMLMTRFAISRKREYMADAGGAELCGNPLALASALRKISADPGLGQTGRDDVAQLFIVHPQGLTSGTMSFFGSMFSTHPDTRKRIEILEQF